MNNLPLTCPQCGTEIPERNLNPHKGLAFCQHCQTSFPYRELLETAAEDDGTDTLPFPNGTCFSYTRNPDGTETFRRKLLGSILTCLCCLAVCAVFITMSILGRLPLQAGIYGGAFALLFLAVILSHYTVITLDTAARCIRLKKPLQAQTIHFDDVDHLDSLQFTESKASFTLRAVLNNGKSITIIDSVKENDVAALEPIIARRCFSK